MSCIPFWFEWSVIPTNLKEIRVWKTWKRIHESTGGGVPVFLEDWRSGFLSGKKIKFSFLSVKKWKMGEITGVKTEEVEIDSLKMWKSKKVKINWEERLLKCEDCEAWTPWYPPPQSMNQLTAGWNYFSSSRKWLKKKLSLDRCHLL